MAERPLTVLSGASHAAEAPTVSIAKNPPSALDQLLEQVDSPAPEANVAPALRAPALPEPPRLVLVRGVRWNGQQLEVALRSGEPFGAAVASEVDRGLLNQAITDGQMLLCEWPERGTPLVVGVVQSKPPSKVRLSAEEIELDASRELLLRSGSAALRLRASGDVELVGSRISAVSRGVMRLIGRLLRLN